MNVDLGDGRVVEFPDSMSRDDVNAAVKKLVGATIPTPAPASWTHYPAMLGQTLANAGISALNAPGEVSGFINKYTAPFLPKILTTPVPDLLRGNVTGSDVSGEGGTIPYANFGPFAQPTNAAERYAMAGLGGGVTAATVGTVQRLPAILSGGRELLGEVPRILRDSGILGAIPGLASQAAQENLGLDSLDPGIRTAIEAGVGATAAIAAHHFLGGNPIEGVAARLGDSETSDEAGQSAQKAVQAWHKKFPATIEALKGTSFGPLGPNTVGRVESEDTSGERLFGKVPLNDAKIDNTQTMAMLHSLSNEGGVYKDVFKKLSSNFPDELRTLFDRVAARNDPITQFGPRQAAPGATSAGAIPENPPQMTGGPPPSYDSTPPLRSDSFQALVPTQRPGEVGFHIPEPALATTYTPQAGVVVGFKAPLSDAMALRSKIGEWVADQREGTPKRQAKALYSALSADIGNTMDAYDARGEWDAYNTASTKLYAAKDMLSRIAGDGNPNQESIAPGKAVESLWSGMRKDSGEVANLREQVPEAADEVAGAFLRNHPDRWSKLPDATQRALVPNPFDRLVLNSSTPEKSDLLAEVRKERQLAELPPAGVLGAGLAELMHLHDQALGATSAYSPIAYGAAAMALPPAFRFLGKLSKNPRLLNVPATGALAATSSPLLGQTGPSQQ